MHINAICPVLAMPSTPHQRTKVKDKNILIALSWSELCSTAHTQGVSALTAEFSHARVCFASMMCYVMTHWLLAKKILCCLYHEVPRYLFVQFTITFCNLTFAISLRLCKPAIYESCTAVCLKPLLSSFWSKNKQ